MREMIFGIIGGVALLMYGVETMGDALERAAGDMMRKILSVLTGTVWRAFIVGTVLTALVQSSTAVTVMTVGFVNARLMSLAQAVGVIYGANIGTTITAQLMAFKLTDYALFIIGAGFWFSFFAREERWRHIGRAVMGMGMMFLGMKMLQAGVPLLQNSEVARDVIIRYGNNPLIAVIIGMVATMCVANSATTVGLTMVLAKAGLLNINGAIGLMLGDNIGTCITAQLAALGTSTAARRTAWAHTLYNIAGVAMALIVLPLFSQLIAATSPDISRQIANSHTLFNVFSAILFLPVSKYYVRFLEWAVPDRKRRSKKSSARESYLDERLLNTPVAALRAAMQELIATGRTATGMLNTVVEGLLGADTRFVKRIESDEESVNAAQRDITEYLVSLSRQPLAPRESGAIPDLLHAINDVERIGDHAVNMIELCEMRSERSITFSDEAKDELLGMNATIMDFAMKIDQALAEGNPELAQEVCEQQPRVAELAEQLRSHHIDRLEEGKCTLDAGILFLDAIAHLERASEHLRNLAVIVAKQIVWASED
ncbi:MAG: Na/Pi cotransporter family protein [Chloroflexota bacterium]